MVSFAPMAAISADVWGVSRLSPDRDLERARPRRTTPESSARTIPNSANTKRKTPAKRATPETSRCSFQLGAAGDENDSSALGAAPHRLRRGDKHIRETADPLDLDFDAGARFEHPD